MNIYVSNTTNRIKGELGYNILKKGDFVKILIGQQLVQIQNLKGTAVLGYFNKDSYRYYFTKIDSKVAELLYET